MKKKVSFRNLLAMMMVAMLCVGISQMQGKSDDGKTFSYTLKKSY